MLSLGMGVRRGVVGMASGVEGVCTGDGGEV